MNVSQLIVMLVVGFALFSYVMHQFPNAKATIESAFGCFSSFKSPLSSPVCALVDFTGVAVVGRYMAKGLQEATSAAKGIREFATGGKLAREGAGAAEIAREAEQAANVAREAREAANATREAREAGGLLRVFT
tara:strand:- start:203 stop:604 length:402 start_codon:yes stop_codon:yes gene_type:complete